MNTTLPAVSPTPPGRAARLERFLRQEGRALLALLVLSSALWLPRLRGPLDLRWDGGVYYVLGTSLAQGHGYRLLNEPGQIAATQYPPLLPLLVAVVQRVLGTSDPLVVGYGLRLVNFALFLLQTVLVYALMRRAGLPPRYGFVATCVFLLNIFTFFLSDLCFPEMLFGIASVAFVLLSQKATVQAARTTVGAALAAVAAYALRTVGIALLAAWAVEAALQRNLRGFAARALIGLAPVLCWQLYVHAVESSPEYQRPAYPYQRAAYQFYNVSYARNIALKDPFAPEQGRLDLPKTVQRFARNLAIAPAKLGEAVSFKASFDVFQSEPFRGNPLFTRVVPILAGAGVFVLGALAIAGLVLQARRRQWLVPLYCLFYIVVVCGTPWPQQFNRYLAPLAPFLILALFECLRAVARRAQTLPAGTLRFAASRLPAAIIALVLLGELGAAGLVFAFKHRPVTYRHDNTPVRYKLFFYLEPYQQFDASIDWLQRRARPGEVAACSMPHWLYLRSSSSGGGVTGGIPAVMPPLEANPVQAQRLLDSVPVTYLFLDKGLALDTLNYTRPVIQRFPDRWKLVYSASGSDIRVYQRVHPKTSQKTTGQKTTGYEQAP